MRQLPIRDQRQPVSQGGQAASQPRTQTRRCGSVSLLAIRIRKSRWSGKPGICENDVRSMERRSQESRPRRLKHRRTDRETAAAFTEWSGRPHHRRVHRSRGAVLGKRNKGLHGNEQNGEGRGTISPHLTSRVMPGSGTDHGNVSPQPGKPLKNQGLHGKFLLASPTASQTSAPTNARFRVGAASGGLPGPINWHKSRGRHRDWAVSAPEYRREPPASQDH